MAASEGADRSPRAVGDKPTAADGDDGPSEAEPLMPKPAAAASVRRGHWPETTAKSEEAGYGRMALWRPGRLMRRALVACCVSLLLLLLLAYAFALYYLDGFFKEEFVYVGSKAFGTDTNVDDVSVGMFSGQTAFTNVTVANPSGYDGNYLTVADMNVDVQSWSLMSHHVEIEELRLRHIDVSLLQKNGLLPNFVTILQRLSYALHQDFFIEPPTFLGGKITARRYSIDTVEMSNLTMRFDSQFTLGKLSLQQPDTIYHIGRVQIKDVGKKGGGVPLEVLMLIVTNSIMNAAIQSAPENLGVSALSAISAGVENFKGFEALDYDSLQLELDVGDGLNEVTKLVDQLKHTTADAFSPRLAKSTFLSAVHTARDMNKVFKSALQKDAMAWTQALTSHQEDPSGAAAVADGVNRTDSLMHKSLNNLAERTRKDGEVGKTVSQVVKTEEALTAAMKRINADARAHMSPKKPPS